ncbi:Acyltransferase family protein [Tautonia plasticadhaerens]|uniref:Acyltransferase family protein n=1 Tax=Tautonia plasticadhaerens TaxID=2527974 RepID=A0A518HDL1_9BACT|nr:Acyltransferase family protein [Tautonia plasticadhaerens]
MKIWPSYFAAYGSIVALEVVAAASREDLSALSRIGRRTLVNSIFVQNYFVPLQWPHSWTIAIEEHFYLLLPLLLLAMTATSKGRPESAMRGVPIVGAAVAILVLGLRLATPAQGALTGSLYYRTHYRVDALMFGVVLGYLGHHCPSMFARLARHRQLLLLLAASALFVPLAPVRLIHTWGFTLLYLGLGGLVVLAASRPDFGLEGPRPLRWSARALALLGVYSYTIYLGHSALEWLRREVIERLPSPPPPWLDQIAFLALSVVAGVALSHAVERPFLRLRERLVPSRRRATPGPVPMPPGESSLGTDPMDARATA